MGFYSTPSFADLDGDGDLDAVVGECDGTLHYFENTGSAIAPAFTEHTGAANPFDGVNVGGISTPSFADLDGDGDLDAVVGASDGILRYFENTGSAIAPAFTEQTGAANPFNGVNVGFCSAPSFADLDGDGDLDAVVGETTAPCTISRTPASAIAAGLHRADRRRQSVQRRRCGVASTAQLRRPRRRRRPRPRASGNDGDPELFPEHRRGLRAGGQRDGAERRRRALRRRAQPDRDQRAADISTSGTLTISDPDSPTTFVAQAGTVGSYGTFAIDAAGAWTYTASSAHNEFAGR